MSKRSKFLPTKNEFSDKKEVDNYITEMVYELQDMYNELTENVDGSIKSSFYQQKELWTPVLNGTTVSGTFTYTNQIGWVFRQGLLVDVWGDLAWTAAGTATGNLYVELPYKVANTTGSPFVGASQISNLALGAGNTSLFIDAITDTYRGEFFQCGSGIANTNLTVQPSGNIKFHVRYLGVQNE